MLPLLFAVPIIGGLMFLFSNVFQTYRGGFESMAVRGMFDSKASAGDAVMAIDVTLNNLEERQGLWTYEYLVVDKVFQEGSFGGLFLEQALENMIPRAFIHGEKETIDADELLEQSYGLPQRDLPTNLIGLTFADFGVAGIAAAAIVVYMSMAV